MVGSGFGRNQTDVASVSIGTLQCTDVILLSDSVLECTAPAQIGLGLDIVVRNRLGTASPSRPLISYEGAVVTRISPRYEFQHVGSSGLRRTHKYNGTEFRITGTGFGQGQSSVRFISIGGIECTRWTWVSPQQISCRETASSAWQSRSVVVELASSQVATATVFRYFGQPRVTLVAPGTDSVLGGGEQSITCTGCGEAIADIVGLHIGAKPCLFPRLNELSDRVEGDPLYVLCETPPGVGKSLSVSMTTRGGLSSPQNSMFTYPVPTVTSVHPTAVLSGAVTYNFTVNGSEFGTVASDIDYVEIGG